ncbi:MAG: hypothetical protein LAT55_00740 [Opitutales bacterium]|nr:hypothetical protein [Opitutales bacterium]
MNTLIKYWYILAMAFVLSLLTGVGLVLIRQDTWMPEETEPEEHIALEEGDSSSFREWNFEANKLEDLQLKLDARQADLDAREESLELLRAQIQTEHNELISLRESLDDMRRSMEQDFITIEEDERTNLRRLASIYSEVSPAAAVKVFNGLDDETIVKILSLMPTESSARVLGVMGDSNDQQILERAARLTSDLRKVRE